MPRLLEGFAGLEFPGACVMRYLQPRTASFLAFAVFLGALGTYRLEFRRPLPSQGADNQASYSVYVCRDGEVIKRFDSDTQPELLTLPGLPKEPLYIFAARNNTTRRIEMCRVKWMGVGTYGPGTWSAELVEAGAP